MFFRKNPNASGSQSNQIIQKINGRYKGVKTIGSATTWQEIEKLENLAKQEVERLSGNQYKLFCFESDAYIKYAFAVYPPHQHRIKRLDFYQKIVEASF